MALPDSMIRQLAGSLGDWDCACLWCETGCVNVESGGRGREGGERGRGHGERASYQLLNVRSWHVLSGLRRIISFSGPEKTVC